MDEVFAARILSAAMSLDKSPGYLDAPISEIPDENEEAEFAKRLGNIVALVNDLLIRPVVKAYPHLDPDT